MNIAPVVLFLIPATPGGVAELEALPPDGKPFAMVPFQFNREVATGWSRSDRRSSARR